MVQPGNFKKVHRTASLWFAAAVGEGVCHLTSTPPVPTGSAVGIGIGIEIHVVALDSDTDTDPDAAVELQFG